MSDDASPFFPSGLHKNNFLAKFLPLLQWNDFFQEETAGVLPQGTTTNFGHFLDLRHSWRNKALAIFLVSSLTSKVLYFKHPFPYFSLSPDLPRLFLLGLGWGVQAQSTTIKLAKGIIAQCLFSYPFTFLDL